VQGGEKPKKPKMELTKEAWELYDSLSDSHKTIFEKMAQSERDKLVDKYISSGGQIQKVKSAKRSEDSKSFPASKRAGTVFNKGAKRVHLQNQGVKGK
jgi:CTP-dependent riboflavin kinase